MNNKVIIFTDLDGTLLDSSYSFKKALPALRMIKEKGIPLVLCSSKTRAEIEHYRKRFQNIHPFISENGGGIFIPKEYFRFGIQDSIPSQERFRVQGRDGYHLIRLGADYRYLRKALCELRSEGFDIRGFGDMSVREVAALTGLKILEARLSKKREFDEPFIFGGSEAALRRLKRRVISMGLNLTRGEFFHLMGNSDKGRAVEILREIYTKQYRRVITIALGDNLNDTGMLKMVDYPVIVKNRKGLHERRIRVRGLIRADGIGPEGWNRVILKLLETLLL
jgi:mannosyl-3-phosphoglycerate phosphatase